MTDKLRRVCIYSQRGAQKHVSRCLGYELEDVIDEIDEVDLVVGTPTHLYHPARKVSNRMARHLRLSSPLSGISPIKSRERYELFFAYFASPSDISSINALRGWRDRSEVAICWLDEIWEAGIHASAPQLRKLADFDAIILNHAGSIDAIERLIGTPCHYLPLGVDAIRFCPYPHRPARCVDIFSLGRRVPEVHSALLEYTARVGAYYVYDTVHVSDTDLWREHRRLTANTARRSQFFVAYPAKFDQLDETKHQSEIGPRFFEGAASGATIIGTAPRLAEWDVHFNWPDAVIELPADPVDIGDWIEALSKDADRLDQARRLGVANTLRRHDWAHRWTRILRLAGLDPQPGLHRRIDRLEELSRFAMQ